MRRIILAVLLLALCAGCATAKRTDIKLGMTYDEVVKITGKMPLVRESVSGSTYKAWFDAGQSPMIWFISTFAGDPHIRAWLLSFDLNNHLVAIEYAGL
ncbi:MAG: hypothetical protein OEW48_09630 [Phycisphaerae bacterium]|nr:hypothetical protein [Phycisphaerae bacterium]